jgi:hypothetical protein
MRRTNPSPTITSSRPGVKRRPWVISIPPRTSKARGVTARMLTLVGLPSLTLGSAITITCSGEARGCPSLPRATLSSTETRLRCSRDTPELSSDMEPRCTMMALSVRPVARRAMAKPSDMAMSTVSTETTRAMPTTASRVTCQRTRRLRRL